MMFLLTCDKKLTKSQLSPTHASTKRKITDELKHNEGVADSQTDRQTDGFAMPFAKRNVCHVWLKNLGRWHARD